VQDSRSKCNSFAKDFVWCFITKTFTGSIIQQIFYLLNLFFGNYRKISLLGQDASYETNGIFNRPLFPTASDLVAARSEFKKKYRTKSEKIELLKKLRIPV
jgi:hypothetical protein